MWPPTSSTQVVMSPSTSNASRSPSRKSPARSVSNSTIAGSMGSSLLSRRGLGPDAETVEDSAGGPSTAGAAGEDEACGGASGEIAPAAATESREADGAEGAVSGEELALVASGASPG